MNKPRIKDLYTIEEVSEVAGVNSFTLRNWEDRYTLFKPDRDVNGRRIYSELDTMRAICASALVRRDFKIGKIADIVRAAKDPFLVMAEYLEGESFISLREQAVKSLIDLDAVPFMMTFDYLFANYPIDFLTDHFFYPIFRKVEEMNGKGEITDFQAQFTAHHLTSRLHRLIGITQLNQTTPHERRVVVTGLPGNRLEDSKLILYLMLERYGWKVFYGGPETPVEELEKIAEATQAQVIILVGNHMTREQFLPYSEKLENLPVPVALGGKLAHRLHEQGHRTSSNVELTLLRPGNFARLLKYKYVRAESH